MVKIVKKYDVQVNHITEWKNQLLSDAPNVFGKDRWVGNVFVERPRRSAKYEKVISKPRAASVTPVHR